MLRNIFTLLLISGVASKKFVVGGLFGPQDALEQNAFTIAVDHVNKMGLPFELSAIPHVVSSTDALESTNLVCDTFFLRGIAIFGPSANPAASQVQSLCDMKEIPNFLLASLQGGQNSRYTMSLFPLERTVGKAIADYIIHLGWNSFVVVYETDRDLVQMQDVLKLTRQELDPRVRVRRLPVDEDYRPLLKEIRDVMNEDNVIVQADLRTSTKFMKQVPSMGMLNKPRHYIFTNLDISTRDFETYKAQGCNISGVRLVRDNELTKALISDLTAVIGRKSMPTIGLLTSAALVYDSVIYFASALRLFHDQIRPTQLSCHVQDGWQDGSTFANSIKMTKDVTGTTGQIVLDSYGRRSNVELQIIDMSERRGFREVGTWTETGRLNITKDTKKKDPFLVGNRKLVVTVNLENPFAMLKEKEERLTGNSRYEGYCIDLLDEISKIMNFSYEIRPVKDRNYGAPDEKTGRWNGLIGELLREEADIAVASLTISYERSSVVDFTVPFMHLGISILFKPPPSLTPLFQKPEKTDPDLFTFLSPLSLDVWVYMLGAYIGVSLTLWILARFSPYEWYNPHPCNEDADIVENQFSLVNSLWFTVGSLMQQGCEISPKAGSTRIVAGTWWFFTLIMISSYTANLAAFLTVERMVSPIESAEDLAKQNKIRYGTLNSGSTKSFFQQSGIETYSRMWAFMSSTQPNPFVNSSLEGIKRVKQSQSKYAYLMESSMLEYYVERDCDLVQVGGLLDSKGYGIAMRKGSPYRDLISNAILKLQEKTRLTSLKEKWWKQQRGGGKCKKDETKQAASALDLANVGGVFVFLLIGMGLSFIAAVAEFVYKAGKYTRKSSIWREMLRELKFAFQCKDTRTQPQYGGEAKKSPSKKLNDSF